MNKKKKAPIDEEEWEEEEEDFDEEFKDENDEIFKCRVCGKNFTYIDGDDYILVCDDCAENYNMDQIWGDYDTGKIREEDLTKFDLKKYRYDD